MPSRRILHKADMKLCVRIASIVLLTLLLSAWYTCNAFVSFASCQGSDPQPQITSLSPDAVPSGSNSVLLVVNGSGFTSRSQILWNGSDLPTTFMDSHQLQSTITHETFASFGGVAGSSVRISVRAQSSVKGCPIDANSATFTLFIN
jgi:hypothetical protein